MAYADFEFYTNGFFGDMLSVENAAKWLERASDELDLITGGRLGAAFPRSKAEAASVKKAVCAVADALYMIDCQLRAVSARPAEDGVYHGAVSAVSSGRESVSFAAAGSASDASAYAAAAADTGARNRLIREIAARYIAGVESSRGENLLYAGVV